MNWFQAKIFDLDMWYCKNIKKRLPMLKQASFWARRLQEMQFSQIVLGKIQFVVQIVILLKVFDMPVWVYIVCLFPATFMLWFTGYYLEKKGIRKHFREAEFKDVRLK